MRFGRRVAHLVRGSHGPACAACGACWYVWPALRVPQGERDAFRGRRPPLGIGCRVEAVNRKTDGHALLETLAIRQGPNLGLDCARAIYHDNSD